MFSQLPNVDREITFYYWRLIWGKLKKIILWFQTGCWIPGGKYILIGWGQRFLFLRWDRCCSSLWQGWGLLILIFQVLWIHCHDIWYLMIPHYWYSYMLVFHSYTLIFIFSGLDPVRTWSDKSRRSLTPHFYITRMSLQCPALCLHFSERRPCSLPP